MGGESTAWREREKTDQVTWNIAIWGDFAWTQVTTTSSALEGMKAVECNVTVDIQGNDSQKIKLCFCLRGQGST